MHIKHVHTNAKVGANVEVGEKTLIVGRNGSGKSTVINAVELALTSRVSDIAGRTDVAREADVMQLAPQGEPLLAEVTFDTGADASYRVEGSTAKAKKAVAKRPVGIDHDEVLPIRTLREAVLGSPTTARKFLLSKVAGDVTRDEIADLLPTEDAKSRWAKSVSSLSQSISAPDALVMTLEKASSAQREATASAKAAREAAKLVGGGRAAPPSKKEVAEATKARDEAREVLKKVQLSQNVHLHRTRLASELEVAAKAAEKAIADTAFAKAELANLPEVTAPHPVFPHVEHVMEACIAEGGECIVCTAGGKVTQADLDYVRAALVDFAATTKQREGLVRTVAKLEAIEEAALRRVEDIESQLAPSPASEAAADANADVLGVTEAEATTALNTADAKLSDLKLVADAWASAKKAEGTAQEKEREAEDWKAFKAACEDAIGIVLGQAVKSFVEKVQSNLPPTDTFDLRLIDGDREVVQFGLVRDGHLHTALSGAEWARVVAAMAEACVGGDKYACLIPEERAFDPETLTDVLVAFGRTKHQVFLASPVMPSSVPAGWTVIERGV
jgi:DNA repair exonuclease SbcCD ATPase subunit